MPIRLYIMVKKDKPDAPGKSARGPEHKTITTFNSHPMRPVPTTISTMSYHPFKAQSSYTCNEDGGWCGVRSPPDLFPGIMFGSSEPRIKEESVRNMGGRWFGESQS